MSKSKLQKSTQQQIYLMIHFVCLRTKKTIIIVTQSSYTKNVIQQKCHFVYKKVAIPKANAQIPGIGPIWLINKVFLSILLMNTKLSF